MIVQIGEHFSMNGECLQNDDATKCHPHGNDISKRRKKKCIHRDHKLLLEEET